MKWALGWPHVASLPLPQWEKGPLLNWRHSTEGELECSNNPMQPPRDACVIKFSVKPNFQRYSVVWQLCCRRYYPSSQLLYCMWDGLLKQNAQWQENPSILSGLVGSLLFFFPRGWHKGTAHHHVYSWGPFVYISTLAIKKWSPLVFPVLVLTFLEILLIQDMSLVTCDLDRRAGGQFVRHHQPSKQTVQITTLTWCHDTAAALQKSCNSLGCHKDTPLQFVRDTFQTLQPSLQSKDLCMDLREFINIIGKTDTCRVTPPLPKRKFHWNWIPLLCVDCGITENNLF